MSSEYIFHSPKFYELKLGEVKPKNWLLKQLLFQAKGITGKLEEVWEDVGENSGWLGGSGENWERGPYYCDGLIPLAYILEDKELIKKAKKWIEWTLNSQRKDGFFGPKDNHDWWSRMVMLKVLKNYYEVTEDERVLDFLLKYFHYQYEHIDDHFFTIWEHSRATENLLVIIWLYEIRETPFLKELAFKFLEKTKDWTEYFLNFPFKKPTKYYLDWKEMAKLTDVYGLEAIYNLEDREKAKRLFELFEGTHVVNVAMGIKYPAVRYLITGEEKQLLAIREGIKNLERYHGMANGMFSGDEHLDGRNPEQGTELCAVVEYMYSLEKIISVFGKVEDADLLEKVAFNALPATLSPDLMTHQYDQQANQVKCSVDKRNWYNNGDDSNIFGLEPNFGCCTANLHQGWPKLVKHMWMGTEDDGLVAVVFGPSEVRSTIKGEKIKIIEETQYPFEDEIRFRIILESAVNFPLYLRIPKWSNRAICEINGEVINSPRNRFLKLQRTWKNNDEVVLNLKTGIKFRKWYRNSLSVERGPLVFALKIKEKWKKIAEKNGFPDFEIHPESCWNYALNVNFSDPEGTFGVQKLNKMPEQPFDSNNAPIILVAKGKKVSNWDCKNNSTGKLPESPIESDNELEEIHLIPYGAARLRISQFPYLKVREENNEESENSNSDC